VRKSRYFAEELDDLAENLESQSDENSDDDDEKSSVEPETASNYRSEKSIFETLNNSPELKRQKTVVNSAKNRSILDKFRKSSTSLEVFYENGPNSRESSFGSSIDSCSQKKSIDSGLSTTTIPSDEEKSIKSHDSTSPIENPFKVVSLVTPQTEKSILLIDIDAESRKSASTSKQSMKSIGLSKRRSSGKFTVQKSPKKQISIRESLMAFAKSN